MVRHYQEQTYTKDEATARPYPNHWDLLAIAVVFSVLGFLVWSAMQMHRPYAIGETIPISLDPRALPHYVIRSVLRMLIAMVFSLIVTFIFGTWAAKSRSAERLIIPMVDVLQSVPILSFLSLSVAVFISLFPHSLLGPECCAIFVIFTSQVWNMILSFYQSLTTIPIALREAVQIFQLSAWQRFWRLDVPSAMPGLLWNMMLSMSGSWFFVVASEAISIANQKITLPGVGSYIAMAITHKNTDAIMWAIVGMAAVIMLYDQLIFRPLDMWIETFNAQKSDDERSTRPWLASLFRRSAWLRLVGRWIARLMMRWVTAFPARNTHISRPTSRRRLVWTALWQLTQTALGAILIIGLYEFMQRHVSWSEIHNVLLLGVFTGARVMVLIIIASLIWLPIGVWIGCRPAMKQWVAPVAQILAAFPSNLLFPFAVMMIVRYDLNPDIWCAPLMVLGTQWYILFNVIAGASEIPKDLHYVSSNLGVHGWLKWRTLILPGVFPYFLTGVITAAGGAWNASVVAETITWGAQRLSIQGLGEYIDATSTTGAYPELMLGTIVMCLYVILINRLLWRPLYRWAEERFS